jgi:hypothetical protein
LRELVIHGDGDTHVDVEASENLMQHIGAATTLTGLCISSGVIDGGANICRRLTALQQLRDLELECAGAPSSREDALHLTTLTGTTKSLAGCLSESKVMIVVAGRSQQPQAKLVEGWNAELREAASRFAMLTHAAVLPNSATTMYTVRIPNHATAAACID